MTYSRDELMTQADYLAQKLKYTSRRGVMAVSPNELQKAQRYLYKRKDDPKAWDKLIVLLSQPVPRSVDDWRCMRTVFGSSNLTKYKNEEIALIMGWAARLLRYYSFR
jgi:hypothetical protein